MATIESVPDEGSLNGGGETGSTGAEGFDCCVSGIPYIHNIHYRLTKTGRVLEEICI